MPDVSGFCVACGASVPERQSAPYRGHAPDCSLVASWLEEDEPTRTDCDECGAIGGHGIEGCPEEWKCCFPDKCIMADPHHHRSECATAEMMESIQLEAELDNAVDVVIRATANDPDPVSMITNVNERNEHTASVVVLRGPHTIELFRQWAERNGVWTRDRGITG